MASYLELKQLSTDSNLISRSQSAIVVAANAKLSGTPTADELVWATQVLLDSKPEGRRVLNALLADNKDASVAQIGAALDSTLQAKVDAIVDFLITAFAARNA